MVTANIEPQETNKAYDSDAIFAKVGRYADYMLAEKEDVFRFGLWSALMLEHLARSVLGAVHPALLAEEAEKNGFNSLALSLGLAPTGKRLVPKSIAISIVAQRLGVLFETITKEDVNFIKTHCGKRNAELHSGEEPFDAVQSIGWEPEFHRTICRLLNCINMELSDIYGEEEAEVANKLIVAYADASAKEVLGEIEAFKRDWDARNEEEKQTHLQQALLWAQRNQGHRLDCPACRSVALAFGDAVSPANVTLEDDLVVERFDVLPSHFECIACGLKISGLSRLTAAGLGDRYSKKSYSDPAEYYAIEPDWSMYEEDNNEPW